MIQRIVSSQRALALTAGIGTGASILAGVLINHYVRELSDDVGFNLLLLVFWTALQMTAAVGQALWLAGRLFGERWRRRTLMGWEPGAEEDLDAEDLKDRTWALYALMVLALAGNYLFANLSTGHFFGWYRFQGFALVQLRSPEPEQRLLGLAELDGNENPDVISRLRGMSGDPDPKVRAEALGMIGDRNDEAGREALFSALEEATPGVVSVAAQALGTVGGEGALEALLGLLSRNRPVPIRRGALTGLGLLRDPRAVPKIVAMVKDPDLTPEERAVAAWALGALRPPEAEAALLDIVELGDDGVDRCAALHAFAQLTKKAKDTVHPRLKAAFSIGRGQPGWMCPRAFVTDRTHQRCFRAVNRPGTYEGACLGLQMSSPEEFRTKLVRAAARSAGVNALPFLAEVGNDEDEAQGPRVWAHELFGQLKPTR